MKEISMNVFHKIENYVEESVDTVEEDVENIRKIFHLTSDDVYYTDDNSIVVENVRVPEDEMEDYFVDPDEDSNGLFGLVIYKD